MPHDYPEDTGLSAWVHRQRNEYRKYTEQMALGEDVLAARPYASKYEARSTLTPERIQTLNDMGFLWQVAKRTGSFFGADRKSWDVRPQKVLLLIIPFYLLLTVFVYFYPIDRNDFKSWSIISVFMVSLLLEGFLFSTG